MTPPASRSLRLSDGRQLICPTPVTPNMLAVGQWVGTSEGPAEIKDLRAAQGGGRIIHLSPPYAPLSLAVNGLVDRYTIVPAPLR